MSHVAGAWYGAERIEVVSDARDVCKLSFSVSHPRCSLL